MADQYVKPGNKERGWNDPPQFSYGLQAQLGSGKRTPLNKRVPAPLHGPPAAPAVQSLPSSTPPKCPASTVGPPPLGQAALQIKSDGVKSCSSPTEVECNIDVKDVITPLNETLEACRDAVKKQVFNDISKRLTMLEEMWNSGKLSPPVRKRMSILIKELKCQNWDSADEIHRSLMVDYVNEVSQWMVGVKRLIAEARNLPTHEKDEKPEVSTGEDVKQEI